MLHAVTAGLIALALCAALWTAMAPAAASEDEDDEAQRWAEEERRVDLRADEDGFRYESRRESRLGSDEMRVRFDLDDGDLEFRFEAEDAGGDIAFRLELGDWVLLEFEDEDGDGRMTPGEPVLVRTSIGDASAASLAHETTASGHRVTARYTLPAAAELSLVFHVSTIATTVGGVPLVPTALKFDVLVTGHEPASAASVLAVEFALRSSTSLRTVQDETPGLEAAAGAYLGFLTWAETVLVDGEERPVHASVTQQVSRVRPDRVDAEARIVFHYGQGAQILHDPVLGIRLAPSAIRDILPPQLGDARLLAAGAAIGLLLVALTLGPRLRRKRGGDGG